MVLYEAPAKTWPCTSCRQVVRAYRGETVIECSTCGASYNAVGQRYRDDWASNPSNFDENIGDVEGQEIATLTSWDF